MRADVARQSVRSHADVHGHDATAAAAAVCRRVQSGDLSLWTSSGGLTPETALVHGGTKAVEGNTVDGATFARKTLGADYSDAYARMFFNVVSQVDQINLLRLRDAAGNSLGYLYLTADGSLAFHNDATATNTFSATVPAAGWHALELHMGINGAASTVEVWLDNVRVADLSVVGAVDLGTAPVGQFQIGEVQSGRVYNVVLDDAAFGTAPGSGGRRCESVAAGRCERGGDVGVPVAVSWQPSTDNAAVVGYDVFRDGLIVGSVSAPTTSFTDSSALAQTTYSYAVRARDASNNVSLLSATASATTPAATPPLFADGFESGTLAAWTSSAGLTPESTDVRTGALAVEGNTANGNTFAAQDPERHGRRRVRASGLRHQEPDESAQPAADARPRPGTRWATCTWPPVVTSVSTMTRPRRTP